MRRTRGQKVPKLSTSASQIQNSSCQRQEITYEAALAHKVEVVASRIENLSKEVLVHKQERWARLVRRERQSSEPIELVPKGGALAKSTKSLLTSLMVTHSPISVQKDLTDTRALLYSSRETEPP